MARRKKTVVEPVVVEEPPTPVEEPRKVLTRSEMDSLARWATEVHYADVMAELRMRDRRELLARIDPKGELEAIDRNLDLARTARATSKSKYLSVAASASNRLGVDVTQYAYDDETGVLTLIPKE